MTMVHTMKKLQDERSVARKAAKRRQYDVAFKRHLVELSLVPGASVSKIALDHRLNANILFRWRRYHLRELARASAKPAAVLLPVTVEAQGTPVQVGVAAHSPPAPGRRRPVAQAGGVIEIDLPLGRVRLSGVVDLAAVRVVIDALAHE
jgi:transposase